MCALQETGVSDNETVRLYRTFLDDVAPVIALKFAARTCDGALACNAVMCLSPLFFMAPRPRYQRVILNFASILAHARGDNSLQNGIHASLALNQHGSPFSGQFADEAQEGGVVRPFKEESQKAISATKALLHASRVLFRIAHPEYVPLDCKPHYLLL